MELAYIPFALVLASLIFNHRYTRHFLALAGGGGLILIHKFFPEAQVTKFDFYFGIGLCVINFCFVAWQTWLFIMPLSKDEKFLYRSYFSNFSKENFRKLMAITTRENKSGGSTIVYEQKRMDRVLMVVDGSASVILANQKIAELKNGDFIGEMSYLSGNLATATVRTNVLTTYLVWEQEELRKLLKKNTSLLIEFNKTLEEQVTKKLIDKETAVSIKDVA